MVNGYLPPQWHPELFAGRTAVRGFFCPLRGIKKSRKALIHNNFIPWHGFCNPTLRNRRCERLGRAA